MKVCTDSCILGAWATNIITGNQLKISRCLDIGTGTGLLSLMLAQKTNAFIDAVEIDENAYKQANDNFKISPWRERLQAIHKDVKYFCTNIKYDFIICNPPFYENDLLSPVKNKNVARHDEGLALNELILAIKENLDSTGSFALILPFHRIEYFENIAGQNHFFLQEKCLIKPTSHHDYFRAVLLFGQIKRIPLISELIIKTNGIYSNDFINLMKEYYLDL